MRYLLILPFILTTPVFAQFGFSEVEVEEDGEKNFNRGTACLIDNDLVITCWHAARGENWRVKFGRNYYTGRLIAKDEQYDLALLRLNKKVSGQRPITVAVASRGEQIHIGGFGGESDGWEFQKGYITLRFPKPGGGFATLMEGTKPRHGDSGGPVVNSKGNLVGIVFAYLAEREVDENGTKTENPIEETKIGVAVEFAPFLTKHAPGHPNWKAYRKVDPYYAAKREEQWKLREYQLENYIMQNNLPVLAPFENWRD